MAITLEQARALDALQKHGTFQAAAAALRKGHTAVVYALRTLEEQAGHSLLDRSGYRTRLTPAGERVAVECRKLLAAEREVLAVFQAVKSGWEPRLSVVLDGIFPTAPVLSAVARLVRERVPTRIDVRTEFLEGVEAAFSREGADLMISILPPRDASLRAIPLAPLPASLLAHRAHPLGRGAGRAGGRRAARRFTPEELAEHVLLTVRGSDPRLVLPTGLLEARSTVRLNDFGAKKAAIALRVGFGWLPDYLAEEELAAGTLTRVLWTESSTHTFEPRLVHRGDAPLGRAAARLVEALRAGTR